MSICNSVFAEDTDRFAEYLKRLLTAADPSSPVRSHYNCPGPDGGLPFSATAPTGQRRRRESLGQRLFCRKPPPPAC